MLLLSFLLALCHLQVSFGATNIFNENDDSYYVDPSNIDSSAAYAELKAALINSGDTTGLEFITNLAAKQYGLTDKIAYVPGQISLMKTLVDTETFSVSSRSAVDLADVENLDRYKSIIQKLQALAKTAAQYGEADGKTVVGGSPNFYSIDCLHGYIGIMAYYIYAYLTSSVTQNSADSTKNIFGSKLETVFDPSSLNSLYMLTAMYYSIKKFGFANPANLETLNFIKDFAAYRKAGIYFSNTTKSDTIPAFFYDLNYLMDFSSPADITIPFALISQNATTPTSSSQYISIDAQGAVTTSSDFDMSSGLNLFKLYFEPSTSKTYVKTALTNKFVVVNTSVTPPAITLQDTIAPGAYQGTVLTNLNKLVNTTATAGATYFVAKQPLSAAQSLVVNFLLKKPSVADFINFCKNNFVSTTAAEPAIKFSSASELKAFLAAIFSFLNRDNVPQNDLVAWDASSKDFINILIFFKKKYASFWDSSNDGPALKNYLGEKYDPATSITLKSVLEVIDLESGSLDVSANLFKNFTRARSQVFYTSRLVNLQPKINSMTTELDVLDVIWAIKDLTSKTPEVVVPASVTTAESRSLDLSKLGRLTQAFPADISALNTVITLLENNNFYTTSFKDVYSSILTTAKSNIASSISAEEYLKDLTNFMTTKKYPLSMDDKNFFYKKLDRLMSVRINAKNIATLNEDLNTQLNIFSYNQLQDEAAKINTYMKQLGVSVNPGAFQSAAADVISFKLSASNVNQFFDKIAKAVSLAGEADQISLNKLKAYLNSAELLNNAVIFADSTNSIKAQIKASLEKLNVKIPFAQRSDSLKTFLINKPESLYIDKTTADKETLKVTAGIEADFIIPFLNKIETIILEKENGSQDELNYVVSLLDYAKRSQLRLSVDMQLSSDSTTTVAYPLMFQGKNLGDAVNFAQTQLQWKSLSSGLTIAAQAAAIVSQLKALKNEDLVAAKKIVEVDTPNLLQNKVDFTQADYDALRDLFENLKWNTILNQSQANFSITFPSSGVSLSIVKVVDGIFYPYLSKDMSFAEVFSTIVPFKSNLPLDSLKEGQFLSRAKKLINYVPLVDVEKDLKEASDFFKEAKFNYMQKYATSLDPVISALDNAYNILSAKKVDVTLENYRLKIDDFKVKIRALTSSNYNTSETPPATTSAATAAPTRLDDCVSRLNEIANNKHYLLSADLAELRSFLASKEFVSNPAILLGGNTSGAVKCAPAIKSLSEDATFLMHYKAFQSLVSSLIKATSTIGTDDFRIALLQEKFKILIQSPNDIATTGLNILELFTYIDSLDQLKKSIGSGASAINNSSAYNAISSFTGVYDSLETVKSRIQLSSRNVELFMLPFTAKVDKINQVLGAMKTADDAVNFYQYAAALVDKRVESIPADLTNLVNILSRAYYSTNFIDLYNTAKNVTNAGDLLNDLVIKFNAPIDNAARVSWLNDMLSSPTLAPHHPVLIMRVLNDFMRLSSSDGSGNSLVKKLFGLLQASAYTTMAQQKAAIAPIINTLKALVDKIAFSIITPQIQALQAKLEDMPSYELANYIPSLEDIIALRLEFSDEDFSLMTTLLNTLKNKQIFVSQKSIIYNGTQTYEAKINSLLSDLATPPSFSSRLVDLDSFYNKLTAAASISELDKQRFYLKAVKLSELKTESLVRAENDPEKDKLFKLINMLTQAAYDKFSSMRQDLLSLANQLSTFRSGVQQKVVPEFKTRIDNLKTLGAAVADTATAQAFVQKCQDLSRNFIAQGTNLLLKNFSEWLKANMETNNAIYKANLVQNIKEIGGQLVDWESNKSNLANRFSELQRMIKDYNEFSQQLKIEFFEKLWYLVQLYKLAQSGPTKDQLKDIITYAKNSIYLTTDVYSSTSEGAQNITYSDAGAMFIELKSLIGSTSKIQTRLDTLLGDVESASSSPDVKTYGTILKDFRDKFDATAAGISAYSNKFANVSGTNVTQFAQELKYLTDNLVDATRSDIDSLTMILKSEGLKTNSHIFKYYGNLDFIDQYLKALANPIPFVDRAKNIVDLINNQIIATASTFDITRKKIFVEKCQMLFDERWRAASEGFNLKTLRDLIYMVRVKYFDANNNDDKDLIQKLDTVINAFLNPATQPKLTQQNFDFAVDDAAVRNAFKNLSSGSFMSFLNVIADIASRRVNAVYLTETDSKTQAETLKDWLYSQEVQLNGVVYQEGNQQRVMTAADMLVQPYTFDELFKACYQFVIGNDSFDTDKANLFMQKAFTLAKKRDLALKENYAINKVNELFTFVKTNRLAFDSAKKATLDKYWTTFSTAPSSATMAKRFDELLKTFKDTYFSGFGPDAPGFATAALTIDAGTNPKTTKPIVASDVPAFITAVEALVNMKSDALSEELTEFYNILNSSPVRYASLLLSDTNYKNKMKAATDSARTPASFAELAANIISMVRNNASFDETVAKRFKSKLKKISEIRGQGYDSNYDIPTLADWVKSAIVSANQMQNDKDCMIYYNTLLTKQKSTGASNFVAYADLVKAKQDELATFTSANDKAKFDNWFNTVQLLIDSRLDGYWYDTSANKENTSAVDSFKDFLAKTAKYNQFVFNVAANRSKLENYIKQFSKPVTFAEMADNLEKFVMGINLFNNDSKALLENKVARILASKDKPEATLDLKNSISDILNYARINKFDPVEEGAFLSSYSDSLAASATTAGGSGVASTASFDSSPINNAVNKLINGVTATDTPEKVSAMGDLATQISSWGSAITSINNSMSAQLTGNPALQTNGNFQSTLSNVASNIKTLMGNLGAKLTGIDKATWIGGLNSIYLMQGNASTSIMFDATVFSEELAALSVTPPVEADASKYAGALSALVKKLSLQKGAKGIKADFMTQANLALKAASDIQTALGDKITSVAGWNRAYGELANGLAS